jgi:hypothetical protein
VREPLGAAVAITPTLAGSEGESNRTSPRIACAPLRNGGRAPPATDAESADEDAAAIDDVRIGQLLDERRAAAICPPRPAASD